MDWYIIEFLYPKAFKQFSDTTFPNIGLITLVFMDFFDKRRLYTFFDNENIYLVVDRIENSLWTYSITTKSGTYAASNSTKSDREGIETEGFEKCFELLERKLILLP